VLGKAEVVTDLIVPRRPVEWAFLKLGRRELNTPAVATVAVAIQRAASAVSAARIALGGAGPFPIRSGRAEAVLTGSALDLDVIVRAAEIAADDARPTDDAIASAWYRRRMIGLLVRRALEKISTAGLTKAVE
jgi:CO/xanthine dehydrogenase FAD-binding subunit